MLWILIISLGWIPGFAFGLWIEERRARRKSKRTIPQSLRDSSLALHKFHQRKQVFGCHLYTREPWTGETHAQRMMREDSIRRILNEPIKPIRKVCGVLASEEAQRILEG